MPAKKSKSINLLPQEEFEVSIVGRILKWAMTTFRFIVIITEMIVMGAFLSRFWLDAQNSDLNDSLKIKSAQISSQSSFENEFRDLQDRISVFKELTKGTGASVVLDKVVSKIPDGVSLQSISNQEGSVQVKGVSASELGIAQFVSNLKNEKSFKNISLGQISSSESNSAFTIFSIRINY
jgi:Tfp pilus assembly protein PilN